MSQRLEQEGYQLFGSEDRINPDASAVLGYPSDDKPRVLTTGKVVGDAGIASLSSSEESDDFNYQEEGVLIQGDSIKPVNPQQAFQEGFTDIILYLEDATPQPLEFTIRIPRLPIPLSSNSEPDPLGF